MLYLGDSTKMHTSPPSISVLDLGIDSREKGKKKCLMRIFHGISRVQTEIK